MKPGVEAREHPTVRLIAWAAGIYEGEGTCYGDAHGTIHAQVVQKDPWLIERFRDLFGGAVYPKATPAEIMGRPSPTRSIWAWRASGARARGFLMTIYIFMSPRRKAQIRKALGIVVEEIAA